MSPDAAMTTPPVHTGPHTAAGKARSSANSMKSGLFAVHAFIREGEAAEYAQTLASLREELSPEGVLEETFCAEIMAATWRLRRCRMYEESLAESDSDQQKAVDRARAHAHVILRRSIAELRKLQTERAVRVELEIPADGLGLADMKQVIIALKSDSPMRPRASVSNSFCKEPKPTPRNAPCPCGSGAKYKRCCGKAAPPVLNIAA